MWACEKSDLDIMDILLSADQRNRKNPQAGLYIKDKVGGRETVA